MPKVLFIEDDEYFLAVYAAAFEDRGFEVLRANDATQGLLLFERHATELEAVVVDMAMNPGARFSAMESRGGFTAGLAVARNIHHQAPELGIIGLTTIADPTVERWFHDNGLPLLLKGSSTPSLVVSLVTNKDGARLQSDFRCFIVHGHDHDAVKELTAFLATDLQVHSPIVLRDLPTRGRTIIEKLEEQTAVAFIAFVLLTPDDIARPRSGGEEELRARQNVIFELGYFFGQMGRRAGRVVILKKGDVVLPSDILGIGTIDITNGLRSVSSEIVREVEAIGKRRV